MESLRWLEREPPLDVAGMVVPLGHAARLARLLEMPDVVAGQTMEIYTTENSLVVLSNGAILPWMDGVVWLGCDGPLWCPTTLRPSVPPTLVARAARDRRQGTHVVALPGIVMVMEATTGTFDPIEAARELRQLNGAGAEEPSK